MKKKVICDDDDDEYTPQSEITQQDDSTNFEEIKQIKKPKGKQGGGPKQSITPKNSGTGQKKNSLPVQQRDGEIVDQEDQNIGGGFKTVEDILDSRPDFLKEENIRDINKKRPDEEGYDPSTLYVPP